MRSRKQIKRSSKRSTRRSLKMHQIRKNNGTCGCNGNPILPRRSLKIRRSRKNDGSCGCNKNAPLSPIFNLFPPRTSISPVTEIPVSEIIGSFQPKQTVKKIGRFSIRKHEPKIKNIVTLSKRTPAKKIGRFSISKILSKKIPVIKKEQLQSLFKNKSIKHKEFSPISEDYFEVGKNEIGATVFQHITDPLKSKYKYKNKTFDIEDSYE